ncbi:MAG: hypothetical protein ACPL06_02870 [Candidatus Anstonellales archaeon]
MLDSLASFVRRVVNAVSIGIKLSDRDVSRLKSLLLKTKRRYEIFAVAILSSLNAGGAKKEDIHDFAGLLEKAEANINNGNAAFDLGMKKKLKEIFLKCGLSEKAADKFIIEFDALLGMEMKNQLMGEKEEVEREEGIKPIPVAEEKEEQKKEQKREFRV